MIGAPRVWDRKLWALRFDPPQTKAHAEDDSDDRDLRQKVFSRGLAVIAVAMGFTLALLGLYAEIAVTSLVCSRLGLRHGAEFVHAAAGVLYFVAVVIAARLAYAGTLE
jgi:hypothetical protein